MDISRFGWYYCWRWRSTFQWTWLHSAWSRNVAEILGKLYAEKSAKAKIPIEMEAAIESNASLSLYTEIVKWAEQYCIKKNDVGKPPSWEAVNNFGCIGIICNVQLHKFKCQVPTNNFIFKSLDTESCIHCTHCLQMNHSFNLKYIL